MSRTYKHTKAVKLKRYYKERWDTEYETFKYIGYTYTWPDFNISKKEVVRTGFVKKAGVKPKKRKEVDTEDHWMSTPSWWNNLFHTRPIRNKFRTFFRNTVKSSIDTLEDVLEPEDSKSPHKYFY